MSDPLEHIINRPDTWRGMNTGENVFAMRASANSDLHGCRYAAQPGLQHSTLK